MSPELIAVIDADFGRRHPFYHKSRREVLMISAQTPVPVAWRVRSVQGNIGFDVQKKLLDSIKAWLPEATRSRFDQ